MRPFTVQKDVEETDHPENAAFDCQHAMVTYLTQKQIFSSVDVSPDAPADADTLVVDATVTTLRIVGGTARFWIGAMAGKSHMGLVVHAKDSRGTQVGQEVVADDSNAFGGAWSMGATDKGLPGDMGYRVADSVIQMATGRSVR